MCLVSIMPDERSWSFPMADTAIAKRSQSSGTSSLPLSGQQSRSPAPTRDSRLICSEFTWTLHSLSPAGTTWTQVLVHLSKFKLEEDYELKELLGKMGMTLVFSGA
ncbi:hypothetical protein N1851_017484 [Merluccius polli]|uniref:Uncharacterized protein n=1 Tax=Merluccius polli TaxID=89951 RepID=A0AA47P182_MERPO|nr:hypothetical protein N1851_017484 [Merluccius polli]